MAKKPHVTVTDAGAPKGHVNVSVGDKPTEVVHLSALRQHVADARNGKK